MATYRIPDNPAVQKALEEYEIWAGRIGCSNVGELNAAIGRGEERDIILVSEALQERRIAAIADAILQRGYKVILIAGPSSSGKSSFMQRLRIQLAVNALKIAALSMDNYFVERENTPKKPDGSYDFDCPETIDKDLFNHQLQALAAGEKVQLPRFDFATGHKVYSGETLQLAKDMVLMVEGIHALNANMTGALNDEQKYCIYITPLNPLDLPNGENVVPSYVRLCRRVVRDFLYRNFTAAATIGMWPMVRENEIKYIYPTAVSADIIVNTSLIYELSVLKPYLLPLLQNARQVNGYVWRVAERLLKMLADVREISFQNIPSTSILREFLGGSTFVDKL